MEDNKPAPKTTWEFLTEEETLEFYGERCPSFAPGCAVCAGWLRYDTLLQWEYEAMNDRIDLINDRIN